MKSRNYRPKSEQPQYKQVGYKSFLRRLSTQVYDTLASTQESQFYRDKSTPKRLARKQTISNQEYSTISDIKQNESLSSPQRHFSNQNKRIKGVGMQFANSMSTKSYDKVVAYGWATMKQKGQDKETAYLSIELGRVKNFVIVDCANINNKNGRISKQICQRYLIEIMRIYEEPTSIINQNQIKKVIQSVNSEQVSIASVLVDQNDIHVISCGQNGIMCYTRQRMLINPFQNVQAQSSKINHNAVRTTRYTSQRFHQNFLSKSFSSTIQETLKVQIKSYKCNQIIWICLLSKKLFKSMRMNNQKGSQYLQNCVNKQFCLNSKTYPYGEIAMESCKKIINDFGALSQGDVQSSAAIIVMLQRFPVENRQQTGQKRLWSNLKRISNEVQDPQKNKPKLLKYVGNRRSFIKNAVQLSNSQKKKI